MALCQNIGIPYDSTMILKSDPATADNPVKYFTDSHEAVTNRNEYKMLENAVKAEKLQKQMQLGEYLPQVAVGVAGIYTGFNYGVGTAGMQTQVKDQTDQMGMAFATVSIPISDWWGGAHKLKQSKAKVESAGYSLAETSELLELQITQARNELYENYFQITSAEKSLEQAAENLKDTQSNYKAGVAGMSDLLEAQAACQDAKNNLTEAQCNYQIKKARYLQTINNYK
jgi:outer membrane protein TolC